jgi:hypothetical protein
MPTEIAGVDNKDLCFHPNIISPDIIPKDTTSRRNNLNMNPHLIGILGDEFESGEGLDRNGLQLVLRGIHFRNDDILVLGKVISQLLPDRGQLLAMSTPWSIWNITHI